MAFFCIHCKSEIDPRFKACPFCGEPITDFLRRHLETLIDGKYQILSRLGVGGMGEVYKVLHVHLNAIRVIKLMRANLASDAGAHERFLREARLATKIQHPSVASLFDFSALEDGAHYMVWEYIEGTNLHELIDQRGPLSPRYAARLAVQALHGLDAIHRAGIVHRDISPENLMITRDTGGDTGGDAGDGHERVKIIDLGIAKSSASEDNSTKTGMFVGKWKYCSPEHLGMLPAGERIDGRADLYSFGIVLYEMLTGVPPFMAETPHAYLMMHSSQQPKPLRETNPGVLELPELQAVIFRALAKDRNARFQTARELAAELERLAPLLPDTGGAPPPLPVSAEVTDDATRAVPRGVARGVTRSEGEAATVVSIAAPAVVARTQEREAYQSKTLDRGGDEAYQEPQPRPSSRGLLVTLLLALAIAGGGAWMWLRSSASEPSAPESAAPVVTAPPVQASMPVSSGPVPAAPGHLGINAFPWAAVTGVRNLDNGQSIEIGTNVVTPAPLDLPPGRYEVTLEHPGFAKPITRTVAVAAGTDATLTVHFSDPATAPLPNFGVAP